jgi:MFS family permease
MTASNPASETAEKEIPLSSIGPFRLLFITRIASSMSSQMQSIAVSWQIYDLTDSAFALGMIGLVQFAAPVLLSLIAGTIADRYDRRTIIRCCYVVQTLVTASLLLVSLLPTPPVWAYYVLLLINSFSRTFESPSLQALVANLVPREVLSRAMSAYASSSRIAMLTGPALGGFIYAYGADTNYCGCLILMAIASLASFLLPVTHVKAKGKEKISLTTVLAGLNFIRGNRVLLGMISLDLLATLFGGMNSLLPIYARDILHIGPWGFGLMRSAPSLGALMMGAVLAHYPIKRGAGRIVFIGAGIYGLMTILFGVSTNPVLSIVFLLLSGIGDMMSVVVRHTLVQTRTPDEMRGRISAVDNLSVSIGSQIGQFEAGMAASVIGTVGSVVSGGIAAVAIVLIWAWRFPELRRIERPDEAPQAA